MAYYNEAVGLQISCADDEIAIEEPMDVCQSGPPNAGSGKAFREGMGIGKGNPRIPGHTRFRLATVLSRWTSFNRNMADMLKIEVIRSIFLLSRDV